MKILALETATEACSAALWLDAGTPSCLNRYQFAPREHNRLILPMIEAILAEAELDFCQLDAIAFGCGPGSFTGVRMAAGVAQGIAFGADLPVIPVSTLAALAQQALDETGEVLAYPCIDARMGEVYWAVYRHGESGGMECLQTEQVVVAGQVALPDCGTDADSPEIKGIGIGSGFATYAVPLAERLGSRLTGVLPDRFPTATCIAKLAAQAYDKGQWVSAEQALPVYLRDDVAKKPGNLAG